MGGQPIRHRSTRAAAPCAHSHPGRMVGEEEEVSKTSDPKPNVSLPPDMGDVHDLAAAALRKIKEAQEAILRESQELNEGFQQLGDDRAKIVALRDELKHRSAECEARVQEVATRQADLDQQEAALHQEQARLHEMSRNLASQQEQLATAGEDLDQQMGAFQREKEKCDALQATLGKKEQELTANSRVVQEKFAALEQREEELESLAQELEERQQQVDREAAEIGQTREALGAMHAQLAHDQKEVAAQREELLARLGAAPPSSSGSSPVTVVQPKEKMPEPSTNGSHGAADAETPASAAARQFRKLRRDAKRRAIGA